MNDKVYISLAGRKELKNSLIFFAVIFAAAVAFSIYEGICDTSFAVAMIVYALLIFSILYIALYKVRRLALSFVIFDGDTVTLFRSKRNSISAVDLSREVWIERLSVFQSANKRLLKVAVISNEPFEPYSDRPKAKIPRIEFVIDSLLFKLVCNDKAVIVPLEELEKRVADMSAWHDVSK